MLAGRTIMALLTVLLQILARGSPQAAPDSGAVLKSARRAQAAFESTRRLSLPERPGGGAATAARGSARTGSGLEAAVKAAPPPDPPRLRKHRAAYAP